ncbi:phosphoglycerate mutase-like protein [Cylindrobasidium torrendii FP15055 ss-10]|uniref:Phosphoglycerate mutase-like protein n=1 Tax=Cylindrobasidium torrendii FP15055 ss-10 TaxID=1314674 RepID=A0A0D7BP19_9AGAR|nr:phosphoglycerate mutase-like protein [Cylindrobasidium torrendii FP15055 ss-10]
MADLERGMKLENSEREALLSQVEAEDNQEYPMPKPTTKPTNCIATPHFNALHLLIAFLAGSAGCFVTQYAICGTTCFSQGSSYPESAASVAFAPPYVGSTTRDAFPPPSPTNAFPSLFPTNVGYAGETPTGAEPALIATAPAQPLHTGAPVLVPPKESEKFDIFKKWGNLAPWYSVEKGTFGVDSGPEVPETCAITGLHLLHRHGARYPTAWASYGGPANFSSRLNAVAEGIEASGELSFMNEWTYKLGEELLTPFGRQQLYDLGISMRLKYGFLLSNFTEANRLPVFRTESQDRMLHSALNFAAGFFGIPYEGQYQQSITIEEKGYNNTLAPYKTCPNAKEDVADRGKWYVAKWAEVYLKDANERLRKQIKGYELTIEDTYVLQQLCAYETVALGYSKFCGLFTEEEWDGFDYALDLSFWYNSAFGSPVARVQGVGYVQELVSRLKQQRIPVHRTSTNGTLDDDERTFPFGDALYVDATHEVVVLNILTALNLTTLAAGGPLPYDHIPEKQTFKVSQLAPFATNVQFQLLECTDVQGGPQIRIIANDGVIPLTGIKGCPEQKDGMCPTDVFVKAQEELIEKTEWEYDCFADLTGIPDGPAWETVTGDAPRTF